MRHLSLFGVCLHFIRRFRSCDKIPRSKYCFYCSCIKMKNYETPSIFIGVVTEEHFCLMAPSCIDLDITEERPPCVDYPRFPLDYKQCDYYEKFNKPIDLLVAFTSVLVRMYVNYILNCLFELDLTLLDEIKLIEIVYKHASGLMYDFFFGRGDKLSFFL